MKLVVPHESEVAAGAVADAVVAARNLVPFSDQLVAFTARLSSHLLTDRECRAYPELQALGFWMRKAELLKLEREFESLSAQGSVLVPRGVVLHFPPANVDTLFIYSWLLALLTGNRNVVRLSQRESPIGELLCKLVRELMALDEFGDIRDGTRFVRYGHEREVTQALSAVSDVRVLWGGDASVNALRSIPLPAWAKEITFPDRWSLAAICLPAWHAAGEADRTILAEQFFNDSFWFDQLACSSPRLVLFCGDPETYHAACHDFFARVANVARTKGFQWATGVVLERSLFTHRAVLDRDVVAVETFGNALTVMHLRSLQGLDRSHSGGGAFFAVSLGQLRDFAVHVNRRDQTLSAFGFDDGELRGLVQAINGKGIDRIVPFGQALQFNRYWDGYDLLREFTRECRILSKD